MYVSGQFFFRKRSVNIRQCSDRVLVILCLLSLLCIFLSLSFSFFSTSYIYTAQLSLSLDKNISKNEFFSLQMKSHVCLLLLMIRIDCIFTWENYELDLFDLVEELGVNTNFYDFINVEKTAELTEIKKAYR